MQDSLPKAAEASPPYGKDKLWISGPSDAQQQTQWNSMQLTPKVVELATRWFNLLQERHRGGWRKDFEDHTLEDAESPIDIEMQQTKRTRGDGDIWSMLRDYGTHMIGITNRNLDENETDSSFDARQPDKLFFQKCGQAITTALENRKVNQAADSKGPCRRPGW